jgi:hypothetical protein
VVSNEFLRAQFHLTAFFRLQPRSLNSVGQYRQVSVNITDAVIEWNCHKSNNANADDIFNRDRYFQKRQEIIVTHLPDKFANLFGNLPSSRPSRTAFPSPVQTESSSVRPDDVLGLDESERILPVGAESGEDDPESSVSVRQVGPFSIPLKDIELVPEREVLQDQRAAGPQGREERSEKDEYHRGNDIMEAP